MNGDELYHYHGGLLYSHSDELYHYGVPGMKWGKRKAKYDYAVEKLQAKQDAYRTHRGVTSAKFQKTALKLNKMKAKRDLADAKAKGDMAAKINAKEKLKAAKKTKDVRDIDDLNLTDKEQKKVRNQKIGKTVSNILKGLYAYGIAKNAVEGATAYKNDPEQAAARQKRLDEYNAKRHSGVTTLAEIRKQRQ